MGVKKSRQEKLRDRKDLPKIEPIPPKMRARWGTGTMVVPAPEEVDEIMRGVPHGKLTTTNRIGARLAKRHRTTIACPMTTGIFAWIAANAADEQAGDGRPDITPYWRTLKADRQVNPKYPGGVEALSQKLASEGHRVVRKGKRYVVADYDKSPVEG